LAKDLLLRALEEPEAVSTIPEDLLAEGYQVMAKEHTKTIRETLAAQIMAVKDQGEDKR